ncbi:hypothetical protein [Pseudomonas brassicacearum]|uniref:Uncharacterized protein n=1 Tax=Pseudomonas brassicacearum TaxID=930166 RepID=A0A423H2A1_9PSED|nr:hypothetical protein [Pseudomonas brassicacearum]RON06357.1 hypothetical protein BK658_00825 [Pseudomonas brassicacearum]
MITLETRLYAVAESCGLPLVFCEAENAEMAVQKVTGQRLSKALSASQGDWVVAPITPEQRPEIETLPPESVVPYLLKLPKVEGRTNYLTTII